MRKCSRGVIAELAVMEISPAPAARTRAAKRMKAEVTGSEGIQISYLQLRSRSLVMTKRTKRSKRNSARRRLSCRSSNASSESAPQPPTESRDAPQPAACHSECSGVREELDDVESASLRRRPEISPVEDEIEAFFAASETVELQRFAAKYNFDFVNDRPIGGRYEWITLNP